jgi:LuxR family maltose regulon positive regulatory protein
MSEDKEPDFVGKLITECEKEFSKNGVITGQNKSIDSNLINLDSQIFESLSERELEVLSLVSRGLSNNQISEKLFISLGTVKWYLNQIFNKLEVRNRMQAVIRARELKII